MTGYVKVDFGGRHLSDEASEEICHAIRDGKGVDYGPIRDASRQIVEFSLTTISNNPGTITRRIPLDQVPK